MSNTFVVVGGSSGIGLGVTQRLASSGHQVIVLSRTVGGLSDIANVTHHVVDVTTDEIDASILPDSIDGLVYCPGSLNLKSFKSLKPDTFRSDFEVNVVGAVKVIQASLAGLKAAGSSSVLLFSTVAVAQGMFAHASIAASKGAIEGLARTLAAELSPETRVNCIAPALTNTPLTGRFFSSEDKIVAMGEKYPLQRTGSVEDFSGLAEFLLGDESSWITGQVLGVDGGMGTLRK